MSVKAPAPLTGPLLFAVSLDELAEVVAHRGQSHRDGELLAVLGDGAREEAPELPALAVEYAELDGDARHGQRAAEHRVLVRRGPVLRHAPQAFERALVVLARVVDRPHDRLVALDETGRVHLRHEVQFAVRVLAGAFRYQAALLLQTTPELRVRQRRQQSDHRERNGALAYEVDLPLEDVFRVVVEADDETGHHLHPVTLNLLYGVEHVAARVLPLLRLLEALDHGRLDAEEDAPEVRAPHQLKQPLVVGEVDARLREELEGPPVALLPGGEVWQQTLDVALVADEVVVNDEDRAAPARRAQRVEFREHLLVGLRARHTPVDFDDVAELATERAAARVLHAHRAVALRVREPEVGRGRQRERRFLGRLVDAPRLSAFEASEELRQRRLGLADEDVVCVGQVLGARRDVRPADDDALAARLAAPDDLLQRILLHDHRRAEDYVRPLDVGVLEAGDVEGFEKPPPGRGEQRGGRGQTQRGGGRTAAPHP